MGDVIGAYAIIRPWYSKFSGRAPTPSTPVLEGVRGKFEKLYTKEEKPGGLPFEFPYEGEEVDDSIPDQKEISRALYIMMSPKALGLATISVDNLKGWYERIKASKKQTGWLTIEAEQNKTILSSYCHFFNQSQEAIMLGWVTQISKLLWREEFKILLSLPLEVDAHVVADFQR